MRLITCAGTAGHYFRKIRGRWTCAACGAHR